MAHYQIGEHAPAIGDDAWVADNATLIGRVRLGAHASVWYGAVLRGDTEWIDIGACSNVQDNSVLHADPGFPVRIGERVTVGHQVMLHGCEVGDGSLIGIGAIVLNGARIGPRCLVGAGALVTEGKVFPEGSLILGSPAKAVRQLDEAELARLAWSSAHYIENAALNRGGRRIDGEGR